MNPDDIVYFNEKEARLFAAVLDNATTPGNGGLRSLRFYRTEDGQLKFKINERGWTIGYGRKESERDST